MQMTCEQEDAWQHDPNQYVADEDEELTSCRVSGEMLLDEIHQVGFRQMSHQVGFRRMRSTRWGLGR